MLKSLERKSDMIFSVPLICWEYRYTWFLMNVQTNHSATLSWITSFTGSKDTLFIHPRALELFVNVMPLDPCPSCHIVM